MGAMSRLYLFVPHGSVFACITKEAADLVQSCRTREGKQDPHLAHGLPCHVPKAIGTESETVSNKDVSHGGEEE
jgi:hypothetical protein